MSFDIFFPNGKVVGFFTSVLDIAHVAMAHSTIATADSLIEIGWPFSLRLNGFIEIGWPFSLKCHIPLCPSIMYTSKFILTYFIMPSRLSTYLLFDN